VLPAGPIELRVVYLENARLPQVSRAELDAILTSAREAAAAHLGKDVRFTAPDAQPITAYFDRIPESVRIAAAQWIYDFKRGSGDVSRLDSALEKDLRETGDKLDAMIAYARPFLLWDVRAKSFDALAGALVQTQLARLDGLRRQTAQDGRPLIDEKPYNEYIYWDMLAHAPLPYEVIVTNQLIASVEYTGNSVHSALRGGVSNGITTPNPSAKFSTTAILSTYPFIGTDPITAGLRRNEIYPRDEALRYAGILLAHELGHQLLHLGHPYGQEACVMNPTPLLHFRQWVEKLAPERCPMAASGAMKPGFARFRAPAPQK